MHCAANRHRRCATVLNHVPKFLPEMIHFQANWAIIWNWTPGSQGLTPRLFRGLDPTGFPKKISVKCKLIGHLGTQMSDYALYRGFTSKTTYHIQNFPGDRSPSETSPLPPPRWRFGTAPVCIRACLSPASTSVCDSWEHYDGAVA